MLRKNIKQNRQNKKGFLDFSISLLMVSLSAILLSLSMPRANFNLSALEWFALVPWLLALKEKRPLFNFLISLWMGILFWAMSIYWLYLVTGLGFFLLLPYMGLYFAVFGWGMGYIKNRDCPGLSQFFFRSRIETVPGAVVNYLAAPLLWILLELIRGFLFGGFPWLNLSHGQYQNIPLLQWASLAGENIISGMVVLVNIIIMSIFLSRGKERFLPACILLLVLLFSHLGGEILLGRKADETKVLRITVIQPNIIVEKWDKESLDKNFDILMGLSYKSLQDKPGLIIWPETSFSYDFEKEKLHMEILKEFTRNHNCYLLVGTISQCPEEKFYNRSLLISPENEISSYDKVRLVPFGEYIPLGNIWPWWKRWVEKIAGYRFSFIPAREQRLLYMDKIPFGVLICFEDIFPGLSGRFKRKGAGFLVNMTDDHWFGKTPAPYQHLAASVLRAVENRLPVVRSANTGVSAFIDSSGRIIGAVKKGESHIFIRGFSVEEILF